ncbi:MAG: hypothetical protein K1X92_00980 [Bacteroidia bacterium]|nr:hypothetical protein [Bacteroidia bacterium]
MKSFKSHHYPDSRQKFLIIQENAIYYYGFFMIIVMLGLVLRMFSGESILLFGVVGVFLSMGLGNIAAVVKLKKTYAEIFFVGEHFSIISIYDILFAKEKQAFPLRYASPNRNGDEIHFTFNDQIIVFKKEDWEKFDEIWAAFFELPETSATV